ncbi:LuxR C-terminal-related transcriptional regulator [Streptomyces massasporeus]|uniref:LuxR C-terminal-related transcriptional regulator n=1 Tax=Streptomyces massasporeus TaxID=67324 RepID=UPI00372103A0
MAKAGTTAATTTAESSAERDLIAELILIRQHLQRLESDPVITGAHKVARNLGPVLEPVWGLLADSSDGVGYLRQYGAGQAAPAAKKANITVTTKAVRAYKKLNLVGPERHQVWAALSNPTEALLRTVSSPLPSPAEREGTTVGLHLSIRPALPAVLHLDWHDDRDVVPALRAVLRRWCDLAYRAGGATGELARVTLASALLARGAALDGDTATVRWFVERWLGLDPSDTRVDGATAALLENNWIRSRVDNQLSLVIDTVTQLRLDASHQHRLHRPAWETQLKGVPLALLSDQPLDIPNDAEDPVEAAARVLLAEQVLAILSTLSEREDRVITKLVMEGKSQRAVAEECGISIYTLKKIYGNALRKLQHPSRSQVLRDY